MSTDQKRRIHHVVLHKALAFNVDGVHRFVRTFDIVSRKEFSESKHYLDYPFRKLRVFNPLNSPDTRKIKIPFFEFHARGPPSRYPGVHCAGSGDIWIDTERRFSKDKCVEMYYRDHHKWNKWVNPQEEDEPTLVMEDLVAHPDFPPIPPNKAPEWALFCLETGVGWYKKDTIRRAQRNALKAGLYMLPTEPGVHYVQRVITRMLCCYLMWREKDPEVDPSPLRLQEEEKQAARKKIEAEVESDTIEPSEVSSGPEDLEEWKPRRLATSTQSKTGTRTRTRTRTTIIRTKKAQKSVRFATLPPSSCVRTDLTQKSEGSYSSEEEIDELEDSDVEQETPSTNEERVSETPQLSDDPESPASGSVVPESPQPMLQSEDVVSLELVPDVAGEQPFEGPDLIPDDQGSSYAMDVNNQDAPEAPLDSEDEDEEDYTLVYPEEGMAEDLTLKPTEDVRSESEVPETEQLNEREAEEMEMTGQGPPQEPVNPVIKVSTLRFGVKKSFVADVFCCCCRWKSTTRLYYPEHR